MKSLKLKADTTPMKKVPMSHKFLDRNKIVTDNEEEEARKENLIKTLEKAPAKTKELMT